MKINVYFVNDSQDRSWGYVFREIYHNLINNHPDIEFTHIHSETLLEQPFGGVKYAEQFMIIENDATKRYIVLSYWDHVTDFTYKGKKNHWDSENCVEIITSSGTYKSNKTFEPMDLVFTPFSYIPETKLCENIIEDLYHLPKRKRAPKNLMFRGKLFGFREFLRGKLHFDVRSAKYNIHDYFNDLNDYYINLNLNGAGEICHRDMEIMGLGNALIRTRLNSVLHNELIPNFHYIAVDIDDIDTTLTYKEYWQEVGYKLIRRFDEVKNDIDYLRFVGENGRRWYEKNGTIYANTSIAMELINLNNLRFRDFWTEQIKKVNTPEGGYLI
jgi:hypothetical protein